MPILTIEAVIENPWNAVTHTIPMYPRPLLLALAHLAVAYCSNSQYLLANAAHRGAYIPPGYEPGPDSPDVHEINEGNALKAAARAEEIANLCIVACGNGSFDEATTCE